MQALEGGKSGSIAYAGTCPGGWSANGKHSSNLAFCGHFVDRPRFELMMCIQTLDKENGKYIFPPELDISKVFSR